MALHFIAEPWHLPANASIHGLALDHHLLLNLWIVAALFALSHLILLLGLVLRRTSAPRNTWRVEYLPLAAITLLFIALAAQAERLWADARYTGADPGALQVEVTAMQFAWYFRYPGTDATFAITRPQLADPATGNPVGIDPSDPHAADDFVTTELVLPAHREVDLTLHAQDVLHGFSIPQMRLQQTILPGQPIHVHFTPTTPGTYAILCTQLCGTGHFRMNANLLVLAPSDFNAWLAAKQSARKAAQP